MNRSAIQPGAGRRSRLNVANQDAPPLEPSPIRARRASQIRGDRIVWLWPGRFAFGRVHVLDGDPGLGKSTIVLDIAARLSRGLPMPEPAAPPIDEEPPPSRRKKRPSPTDDASHPSSRSSPSHTQNAPQPARQLGPCTSLVISAEDHEETTIQPRLEAAGADLDRIILIDEIEAPLGKDGPVIPRPILLPDDIAHLERMIGSTGARLLIIDPLMAFIGSDRRGRQIDAHKDQSIRQLLYALRRLAERLDICIILIRHMSKSVIASALRRGLASIGITASARSVMMVAEHPDRPGDRALAGVKTNLDFMAPTLAYRVVRAANGASRIEWLDDNDYSADDLLRPRKSESRTPTRQSQAVAFLREVLKNGPVEASVVLASAAERGFVGGSLRRASEALEVEHLRQGKQWVWKLSDHEMAFASLSGI